MGEAIMGMNEEKKPVRMVSRAEAMDFAEAVCRASGWPVDDDQEDLRRASEAWDAQEEDEETEMDPNEALKVAKQSMSVACMTNDEEVKESAVTEMMDAFQSLDDWLTAGGFLPTKWNGDKQRAASKSKVFFSEATAPDYEASTYVEVKFYLTITEAQEWVDSGPPWWASKNVEQHLRKAQATS